MHFTFCLEPLKSLWEPWIGGKEERLQAGQAHVAKAPSPVSSFATFARWVCFSRHHLCLTLVCYTIGVNAVHTAVAETPPVSSPYTPDWGKPYSFWKSLGLSVTIYVVALYGAWLSDPILQFLITSFLLADPDKVLASPPDLSVLRGGLYHGLGMCIAGILGIFLLREVILHGKAPPRAYFGRGKLKLRESATCLLLTVLYFAFAQRLLSLINDVTVSDFWVQLYRSARPVFPLWLGTGILAPLFEEMLFRGLLFTGARQTRLGVTGCIVFTALLFAVTHYPYGVFGVLWVFVLGLLLGVARHRSDTIKLPFLMHATWNLLFLASCAAAA